MTKCARVESLERTLVDTEAYTRPAQGMWEFGRGGERTAVRMRSGGVGESAGQAQSPSSFRYRQHFRGTSYKWCAVRVSQPSRMLA
jgi:hypothetical protein